MSTMIPTTLLEVFAFNTEPYMDDVSTIWKGQLLPGILTENNLPSTIGRFLSWQSEAQGPWTVWHSADDLAILLLDSENESIQLRLHDTARDFRGAQLYLEWLACR